MQNKIKELGGFLLLMYIPIFIGFVWVDFQLMCKILSTNCILVLGILFCDVFNK